MKNPDMPIGTMTLEQLTTIPDAYSMVSGCVPNYLLVQPYI
jgi:hypothetical protein